MKMVKITLPISLPVDKKKVFLRLVILRGSVLRGIDPFSFVNINEIFSVLSKRDQSSMIIYAYANLMEFRKFR